MKHQKWLSLIVIVLILFGSYFVYRSVNTSKNENEQMPLPDYSGIHIDHIIKKDRTIGKGRASKVGDRLSLHQSVWVYDPVKPGNRGELLYVSPETYSYFLSNQTEKSLSYWLLGVKAGSQMQLIVPETEKELFQSSDWLWPSGRILLFEYKVIDVH